MNLWKSKNSKRHDAVMAALADLARRMDRLAQQEATEAQVMSQALDDLTAEVSSTGGAIDSAVVLINGLADKVDALIAAGNNDPALAQLAADLRAKKDALAQAVADNPVPA
jgi:RecA/RadA recombinase